ncbi:MAG: type II secretion system protein GspD, partial [Burkholderiales bacterium]
MNATVGTGRLRRRTAVRALALVAAIAISGAGQAQARPQGQRAPDAAKRAAAPANGGLQKAATNGGAQTASGDLVTLNFRDAEVDSVVGAFGHLLGRTFVVDPRVRGKMTLETPRPVTREQAYRLLQSALRSQGFAVVETGALTKVVPEADAKLQSTPVSVGRSPAASGDEVVTQIFRLNYESASNLVPVLRPLISPNNTVVAYPNNNSLVVTDYAANVERIARIVATLDSPSTREVEVIPVQYAVATDIAVAIQRLLEQPAAAGAAVDPGQRVVVMADPRTNSILLRAASPAKVGLAKGLIARLDQPSARPGNINVVYLRNAEAVKLAQTLRGVLGAGEGASSASPGSGLLQQQRTPSQLTQDSMSTQVNTIQPVDGSSAAPLQPSQLQPVSVQAGGAIIAADPSTNSLIITAPEPIYRNLRAVIDKLDARRAQVFIESLIVEISAEKAAELGVQWQFLGSPHGSTRVIGGTNLPARGSGANILDAAANIGSIG